MLPCKHTTKQENVQYEILVQTLLFHVQGRRKGRRKRRRKRRRKEKWKGRGEGGGKEEGKRRERREEREEERFNLPVSSQVAGMVSSGGRERCWGVVVRISGVPVGVGHMVQEPCLGLYLGLNTTMLAHNV